MGGVHADPLPPGLPGAIALETALFTDLLAAAATQRFVHPALEGPLLGDRHLALHLEHLAGPQLRVEGADQVEALEEHLHRTVMDSGLVVIQLTPVQFGVEAAAVGGDLILRQLTRFPQPAVGVAVEPSPVQKWVQVDGATTQLNAVLLQTPLQLQVLRLGRRHIKEAGGPRYRPRTTGSSPIPTR